MAVFSHASMKFFLQNRVKLPDTQLTIFSRRDEIQEGMKR